ncbi:alpha/beta fold hydrolase [Oceanobacillus salinisoli]|uniref:alpha/beta fold hydrolase n=1 Tax=Oceanobacillus salinisoli TaxID=2678611 RepID=UPI0012E200A6|nr:alpha/beta fold hydrolase [Oceanobacillus salinisoli]
MKHKLKHIISIILFIVFIFGTIAYIYVPNRANSEKLYGIPTVFVHGYKGTTNSFHTMLDRFEENGWGKKGLVYYVSSRGRVVDHPVKFDPAKQTFVQVILQNNRASFADSAEWLASVLQHFKAKYGVETVNLVGHSMGGIISMKYMMDYRSDDYPNVDRFVAIGSPFDGIYSTEYFRIHHDPAATDLKPDSPAFQMLHQGKIPGNIEVLNIGSAGDTVAFTESVKAIRKMVSENQLREVIIQDNELGHSGMHESIQVDKMIHSFLWHEELQ